MLIREFELILDFSRIEMLICESNIKKARESLSQELSDELRKTKDDLEKQHEIMTRLQKDISTLSERILITIMNRKDTSFDMRKKILEDKTLFPKTKIVIESKEYIFPDNDFLLHFISCAKNIRWFSMNAVLDYWKSWHIISYYIKTNYGIDEKYIVDNILSNMSAEGWKKLVSVFGDGNRISIEQAINLNTKNLDDESMNLEEVSLESLQIESLNAVGHCSNVAHCNLQSI